MRQIRKETHARGASYSDAGRLLYKVRSDRHNAIAKTKAVVPEFRAHSRAPFSVSRGRRMDQRTCRQRRGGRMKMARRSGQRRCKVISNWGKMAVTAIMRRNISTVQAVGKSAGRPLLKFQGPRSTITRMLLGGALVAKGSNNRLGHGKPMCMRSMLG